MRRYLLTALLIGALVAAAVLALYFGGVFANLGRALGQLYASIGFFPVGDGGMVSEVRWHWLEATLVVLAAFAASWCVIDIPQVGHKMLVFLTIMILLLGLSPTLALYGVLFAPFSSLGAAFLATAAGLFYAGTEHGMRKRVLQNVLGARISQATFTALLDAKEPPKLSGATREASVLTCRIFNHAELRDRMEPHELIAMSNLFLRNTADFLMSRGCYLDESSPDLVRVFFGMLRDDENHAVDACQTALELRTRLRNLNDECENRWFQKLDWGVAISSGPMTVGVYGSPKHFYFSGIGVETDYCRRLAQANQRYGSDVLVSAATQALVQDRIEVRPMEMSYDPQVNTMTEVYQLLETTENFAQAARERRDVYWQGVICFRAGQYEEALELFSKARQPGLEDGPSGARSGLDFEAVFLDSAMQGRSPMLAPYRGGCAEWRSAVRMPGESRDRPVGTGRFRLIALDAASDAPDEFRSGSDAPGPSTRASGRRFGPGRRAVRACGLSS